jgi:GTP-binding protein
MKRPAIISLIGRPNVGKSTLFNRLLRHQHKAITFDRPGVTRDRHYAIASFDDLPNTDARDCVIVDTGGFYPQKGTTTDSASIFFEIMREHAKLAIEESDLVLFVVDCREGLSPLDEEISRYLLESGKPVWTVVNKFDDEKQTGSEAEFYALGPNTETIFVLSSSHGTGVPYLREAIHGFIDAFEKESETETSLQSGVAPEKEVVAKVAIIGAPNVGKSTLLNAILGQRRALVSDVPGTTIDPIEGYFDIPFGEAAKNILRPLKGVSDDTLVNGYKNFIEDIEKQKMFSPDPDFTIDETDVEEITEETEAKEEDSFPDVDAADAGEIVPMPVVETVRDADPGVRSVMIVDTAGIRRNSRITDRVEELSVYRGLRSIAESDVVLLVVDTTKGLGHQDSRLIDIAIEKGKSILIVANKWDLIKDKFKNDKQKRDWMKASRDNARWLDHCEVIPLSALTGENIKKLKSSIRQTIIVRNRELPTADLNRCVSELVEATTVTPKHARGKPLKIRYASLVKKSPPTILLFSNLSKNIPVSYRRYLANGIRERFNLVNTPVHLIFRTKTDLEKAARQMER